MKPWIKRSIKRSLIGLLGAGLVFGSLAACRHHHGGGWGMNDADAAQWRSRMVERVGSKLDLNAQQKALLTTLAEKLSEQRKALTGQNADPRSELAALLAGSQFDRAGAKALIDNKTAALQSKSPEVIDAAAQFFDSLNPEQQAKVRDFLQRRGWHRG